MIRTDTWLSAQIPSTLIRNHDIVLISSDTTKPPLIHTSDTPRKCAPHATHDMLLIRSDTHEILLDTMLIFMHDAHMHDIHEFSCASCA
jgi:hypothetical protein